MKDLFQNLRRDIDDLDLMRRDLFSLIEIEMKRRRIEDLCDDSRSSAEVSNLSMMIEIEKRRIENLNVLRRDLFEMIEIAKNRILNVRWLVLDDIFLCNSLSFVLLLGNDLSMKNCCTRYVWDVISLNQDDNKISLDQSDKKNPFENDVPVIQNENEISFDQSDSNLLSLKNEIFSDQSENVLRSLTILCDILVDTSTVMIHFKSVYCMM
jgi:hypothetical protein